MIRQVAEGAPKYESSFRTLSSATLDMSGLINGSMRQAAETFAQTAVAVKTSQIITLLDVERTGTATIAGLRRKRARDLDSTRGGRENSRTALGGSGP